VIPPIKKGTLPPTRPQQLPGHVIAEFLLLVKIRTRRTVALF
jgi:hypothetical protein